MSPHRTWCRIVLLVAGGLVLSGLLRISPLVVVFGVVAATLAGSASFAWTRKRDGEHARTSWDAWSKAWWPAALGFIAVLVLNGLHALLGSAALPIGVAAAITGVITFVVLRRPPGEPGGEAAEPPAPAPRLSTPAPGKRESHGANADDAPPMPALPTQALCWEWRRSYLAVTGVAKPDELMRIVALRASYLDELERRDPKGFRRWLDSGARAASDPGRYLASG